MARWRLLAAHYLYTNPPTQYTHTEVSRETGRAHTQVMNVPRLLEPKDAADHNYPGDIIVSDGNNPEKYDVVFLGEPTSDMEPLDAEAKKITQGFIDSGKWKRPVEGEVLGESLIKQFMEQIAKLQAPPPVSAAAVDAKAFAELQAQVKSLVEQNAKLVALQRRP